MTDGTMKMQSSSAFSISGREYPLDRSYVMGIVNVTPDSFSDGGKNYDAPSAIDTAAVMIDEGVDFIDIGGESTRPGAPEVSIDEELRRVIPVVEGILKARPQAVISVDTTKREVAREALRLGAKIINDISGLAYDESLASLAAEFNAALVIMHMKGTPRNMQNNPVYDDVVAEVKSYLEEKVQLARQRGVREIIIDPGIGFGKTVVHNYQLLSRLDEFRSLGLPILMGLSRKSFLGKSLGLQISERDNATVVAETLSLTKGARIIRTHNTKNAIEAKKLFSYFSYPDSV